MNKFILRSLNKLGVLPKINTTGKLTLNNKTFSIPVIKSYGYNNLFMSEIWMVELLQKLLKNRQKHKKFIDVGVNIGQTLLKLRSVSQEINYLGFEPNPACVFYVNELIKSNRNINTTNTSIYPVGLSENTQVLTLNLFSDNELDPAASVISDRGDNVKRKVFVPIFSASKIDEDENVFSDVEIIKIDVEGLELEVLRSLKEIINKERPLILIEILPVYNSSNKGRFDRQNQIEELFSDINYDIHRVEKTKNMRFSHLNKLDSIGIHDDLNLCDYVIIPTENTQFTSIIK